jgi:hypothetical protein
VPIDTRELIEAIVTTVAHQAAEAEARIRIDPLPQIVSDRLALEQIFSNLIDNRSNISSREFPGTSPSAAGPSSAVRFSKSPTMAAASIPRTTSGFLTCSAAPEPRTSPDKASVWPMSEPWCAGSVEPCRSRQNFTMAALSR